MTAFDHRLGSGARFKGPIAGTFTVLGRHHGAGLKRLQYGRMISVLDRLPDLYLAKAGLQRRDIPERARQAVYGDD